MISFRDSIAKIGIARSQTFSLRAKFGSFPASLRQAIQTTRFPQNWNQVSDNFEDESWTDEVQGAAWDGHNWLFSCNANQNKPGHRDKSLYTFPGGNQLHDDDWSHFLTYYLDVHFPVSNKESDNHWGQLCFYNGEVYVSHFWEQGAPATGKNVVVFSNNGGQLSFARWIKLSQVTSSDGRTDVPEFQAINPWDGMLYTCLGGDTPVREFFIHDIKTGLWTNKTLRLIGTLPQAVQGACFSPNGHLYVAVDARFDNWNADYKWIFYYSALSGAFLGKIPVLAQEGGQELEGICYGAVAWSDGRKAQIHAVLLENHDLALDNIFFKSFSADDANSV